MLPSGEGPRHLPTALTEEGEELVDVGDVIGVAVPPIPTSGGSHQQVILNRERRKELPSFGDVTKPEPDSLLRRPAGDVPALIDDLAARRAEQAEDRADERALARAVRAQ